jgi:hypothetical protein
MPVIISFTEEELLQGTVLDPSWYRVRVSSVGQKLSKDQGSTNYPTEAVVICDANTGDTKFAGVPIIWNFNSKYMKAASSFLQAFGLTPVPGQQYALSDTEGKEVEMFVANKEYNNRVVNDFPHQYRPVRT